MGLANSPGFIQHRMESLLHKYLWRSVVVYIDDILIASVDTAIHLRDLEDVLSLLESSGITLSLAKCHWAQPSIKALGHRVSRLGLSTMEEKVVAIRHLEYPTNLADLECGLTFFGYYRKFVPNFAGIAEPLEALKTAGFRSVPKKTTKKKRRSMAEKEPFTMGEEHKKA